MIHNKLYYAGTRDDIQHLNCLWLQYAWPVPTQSEQSLIIAHPMQSVVLMSVLYAAWQLFHGLRRMASRW